MAELSISELSKFLNTSSWSVKQIPNEKLPFHYSEGGHRRYNLIDVNTYIDSISIISNTLPLDYYKLRSDYNYFLETACFQNTIKGKIQMTNQYDNLTDYLNQKYLLISADR